MKSIPYLCEELKESYRDMMIKTINIKNILLHQNSKLFNELFDEEKAIIGDIEIILARVKSMTGKISSVNEANLKDQRPGQPIINENLRI